MMILRFALVALIALVALFSRSALAQQVNGPSLKRSVVVRGELVRIGDLIDNAGAVADIAVFRSPDLGVTGAVPTAKVLDAVRPYQLFAVETAGISEVEVIRASRVISGKDIENRIARAFAGQYGLGDAGKLTVRLERDVRPLYIDPSLTDDLDVTRALFDPRSGRFDISFELPGVATQRTPLRFTGTLFEGVEAAVLTRSLDRGELVRASDVTIERRSKTEIAADTITRLDQIVGFNTRTELRSGQLVRRPDVAKADVVQRNDPVTLVYEVPGITLTTRGKAIDAGATGDLINVLNIQTKRTVQGTIAGPGRVIIAPATSPFVTASVGQASDQLADQPADQAEKPAE